jgi:hypothetical protein
MADHSQYSTAHSCAVSPSLNVDFELGDLKPRALKKLALEVGVDQEQLDEADDADDVKSTVIELILEKERERAEAESRAGTADASSSSSPVSAEHGDGEYKYGYKYGQIPVMRGQGTESERADVIKYIIIERAMSLDEVGKLAKQAFNTPTLSLGGEAVTATQPGGTKFIFPP